MLVLVAGGVSVITFGIYQFTLPIDAQAIATPWTDDMDADAPLPEYPRPQLRRERWQNLNGRWQMAIAPLEASRPDEFAQSIVVPFAIESMLSGVERSLLPDERLWYRHVFTAIAPQEGERLLLHFGAVDWEAQVWLNSVKLGEHRGGFDPFSFDVTDALVKGQEQELVVAVWDPTNTGSGAFGKQDLAPSGISYTPVSGIWQTVWLEPVPALTVSSVVAVDTDIALGIVTLRIQAPLAVAGDEVLVTVSSQGQVVTSSGGALRDGLVEVRVSPPDLRLWSPTDPFLYDLDVVLLRDSVSLDRVTSYFGAREVGVATDEEGIWRLYLNGEPLFHLGLLDQGWWPDGLYTAPTDEALAFDIEATKRMGFNTIRKHVKVEPARWYWHADRLGVLVWQDMPTGGDGRGSRFMEYLGYARDFAFGIAPGDNHFELTRSPESAAYFRQELKAMMDALSFFPSVVAWVPFNEAWGQFDTDSILEEVAQRDPSRIVDGPSGWVDTGSGDLRDLHMYAREDDFVESLDVGRPVVYGEYGGLGYAVEGHLAVESGWAYASLDDQSSYAAAYETLNDVVESLVPRGLAAAIYTQTTDVESEINGLMTYDRKQFKIPPEQLTKMHNKVIGAAALE
ncbi:MAG: beta-galactosidase/beta-glucuronidase [Halioglobus sp.]